MTGHIRKRGATSYELKFDIDPDQATGKRKVRYASFKGSRKEAQIELARLVSEYAAGTAIDPSRMTIADFVARWERDWAKHNVSAKTFERYSEINRKHVVARIGNTRIQKLRPVDLNELYGSLLRDGQGYRGGLSPRTVGHVHRCIHRWLGHARQWGIVRQNVADDVCPPRVEETEIQILSASAVQTVLKRLTGRILYTIGMVALSTGMRRGELCGLRWKDIDLDRSLLHVEQSIETTKAGLKAKSPKTRHGRRTITLPTSAVSELRAHRKRQSEHRLKIGLGKAPDDSAVFANWEGNVRSPDALTKEWAVSMADIGVEATLHSLRHTHASHLIAAGLDILTISRRLGHGSPGITLKVYGHLFANRDDRAADVMEMTFTATRLET